MNHTGNHLKNINAIIDTGAQVSIIEQQLVNELNWDVERTSLTISGIDGPDRKIKSAYACYGLITISLANPTIIQLFYIMPKMNAPILFGSDFIKLMQIAIQPKPNGAYLLCQRNQLIALGQLTPLSIQAMRKKKKKSYWKRELRMKN